MNRDPRKKGRGAPGLSRPRVRQGVSPDGRGDPGGRDGHTEEMRGSFYRSGGATTLHLGSVSPCPLSDPCSRALIVSFGSFRHWQGAKEAPEQRPPRGVGWGAGLGFLSCSTCPVGWWLRGRRAAAGLSSPDWCPEGRDVFELSHFRLRGTLESRGRASSRAQKARGLRRGAGHECALGGCLSTLGGVDKDQSWEQGPGAHTGTCRIVLGCVHPQWPARSRAGFSRGAPSARCGPHGPQGPGSRRWRLTAAGGGRGSLGGLEPPETVKWRSSVRVQPPLPAPTEGGFC